MVKMNSAEDVIASSSKTLARTEFMKEIQELLQRRWRNDSHFRWVIIGGAVYICLRLTSFDIYSLRAVKSLFNLMHRKVKIPESVLMWLGEVESEVPFGRLGYMRCLECDSDVLEKYGIPMNTEKCLRDGFHYLPWEFYPQFDLNEFDPKVTPLTWSYGDITDPGLIMPIGWYNDMSGENQDFELFCRYMRIYGYLPPSSYVELFRHCKIRLLASNERLIKIGDPDDKVYIIVHGAIDVYSNRIGPHNDFIRLRTATHGGNIASLFSIIDLLSGYAKCIKSIYAVSKLNTTKILVFPIAALKDYLVRNPEYLVSSIVRVLERGYRFQYQLMHVALRLTPLVSTLDPEPLYEQPIVTIPEPEEEMPENIKEKAIQSFMKFLEMDDIHFLMENCNVMVLDAEPPTNDIAAIQNSILNHPDTAYRYIYAGTMEEFYLKSNLGPMDQNAKRKIVEEAVVPAPLTKFYAGEGIGSLTGILGYFNLIFTRCLERCIVVTIDRLTLQKILEKNPISVFPIAYGAVSKMSAFARAMDFALEWASAKEGQYIYHKEQMCYDSYLILSGRARAYQLDSMEHRAILEYKENDWMGIIESLLQSKRRSKTCVVIRETEFVKIPNSLLRNIVINYSEAAQIMLNFLVQRTLHSRQFEMHNYELRSTEEAHRESRRVHSVALVPVAEGIPYSVLAVEIKKHYLSWGSCVILTYEKMLQMLRKTEITVKEQVLLEMYILKEMERNDLVIFVCVPRIHYWNQICSSHSEVIFTVGCSELPNIPTVPEPFEEEITGKKLSTRRKELIILHHEDGNFICLLINKVEGKQYLCEELCNALVVLPRNTKEWLFCRDWIHFHHHIRLPNSAFDYLGAISEEEIESNYHGLKRDILLSSDLSRFVRWIQGKTFGVLFSSGGARIGAQLGMLQALVEYKKIPIDMVVGTGAGFLLAACYAIYQDYKHVQNIIEKVFKDFKNGIAKRNWNDITFPYISPVKGKRILTYFYQLFGSVQLEDTWIPICCVTTNLTSQDVRVNRSGPIWVYIRASLSHINNSPPICDPIDQDYIVDGAHANSLPQDIIKEYGAEYIMAFNTLGGKWTRSTEKADPNVSVFRFLKKTLYTVVQKLGLASPSIETVFAQLAVTQTRMYAAGAETVSNLKYVVYVRPPVEHMPSQTWENLPTLHRTGYFYMKGILDKNPYRDDIPFNVFWTNIKRTSNNLANESGRELHIFNR